MITSEAINLAWKVEEQPGMGWDVLVFDPADPEEFKLVLTTTGLDLHGFESSAAARKAAAARLRELAYRIEQGQC